MSDETPKPTDPKKLHWLVRPGTIKLLWVLGLLTLAAITGLSLSIPHPEAKFGLEATPAFYSWYGFVTCLGMVVFAKFILGKLLSRRDTFYDD